MKLNLNCSVEYVQSFLSKNDCDELFNELLTYKELTTPLKIKMNNGEYFQEKYGKMMFLDEELFENGKFPELVWGPNKIWSKKMALLKKSIEKHTGIKFETCVCIFYPNGNSGVDFHSDYIAFGDTTIIPSLSIGEERIFLLREKETGKVNELKLKNGSLLVMGEYCQERYEHALPLNSDYKKPRINLTFRKYGFNK